MRFWKFVKEELNKLQEQQPKDSTNDVENQPSEEQNKEDQQQPSDSSKDDKNQPNEGQNQEDNQQPKDSSNNDKDQSDEGQNQEGQQQPSDSLNDDEDQLSEEQSQEGQQHPNSLLNNSEDQPNEEQNQEGQQQLNDSQTDDKDQPSKEPTQEEGQQPSNSSNEDKCQSDEGQNQEDNQQPKDSSNNDKDQSDEGQNQEGQQQLSDSSNEDEAQTSEEQNKEGQHSNEDKDQSDEVQNQEDNQQPKDSTNDVENQPSEEQDQEGQQQPNDSTNDAENQPSEEQTQEQQQQPSDSLNDDEDQLSEEPEEYVDEKYELSEQITDFINQLNELPIFENRDKSDGYSIDTNGYTKIPESIIKTLISKFINQRFLKRDTDLNLGGKSLEKSRGFYKWEVKDVITHLQTHQITKVLSDKYDYEYSKSGHENIPFSVYFDMSGSMGAYTNMLSVIAIELLKKDVKVLIGFNEKVNVQIDKITRQIDVSDLAKILESAGNSDISMFKKDPRVSYKYVGRNLDDYLISNKAEKCVVFADFHPIEEIINLSHHSDVYWFCFESSFENSVLEQFKGFIYKVKNDKDLMNGLIKINEKKFEALCYVDNPKKLQKNRRVK